MVVGPSRVAPVLNGPGLTRPAHRGPYFCAVPLGGRRGGMGGGPGEGARPPQWDRRAGRRRGGAV